MYLQKITEQFKNTNDIRCRIIQLSINKGKAWVFSIVPFSNQVNYYQYQNPSSVPDDFIDTHIIGIESTIAFKGQLVGFSESAIIRDRQKGYTADR